MINEYHNKLSLEAKLIIISFQEAYLNRVRFYTNMQI
jgi:hypothetical protein